MPVEPGYAPAGSSGVSITTPGGFLTVTPSPGTGVMTIVADVPAAPVVGNLAVWKAASGLIDGGPVPSGGGGMTALTANPVANPASYYTMFPATVAQVLTAGQRLFVRAVVLRPTAADAVVLGIARSDGHAGYFMSWQADGHVLIVRQNNGSTTTIATLTVAAIPVAGYFVFEFTIVPNNGANGNNIYVNFVGEGQTFQFDPTYDVTAGTWFVVAGAPVVANVIDFAYSTKAN